MIKTLFFDFDGTIHNAVPIYLPAFQAVYDDLVQQGLRPKKTWDDASVHPFLGQSAKEMWDTFAPDIPVDKRNAYAQQIRDIEADLIKRGQSQLFDGAFETLKALKQDYHMVFFSNCSNQYLNWMKDAHHLDALFDDYLTAENFNYQPKAKTLAMVKSYFPADYVFIGDRHHDFEAGQANNVPTVGCAYGFGGDEITQATTQIARITDLPQILAHFPHQ